MNDTPQPHDPDLQLHGEIHYRAATLLRSMLPPPLIDTPEERAIRDQAALAEAVALIPGNLKEVSLAVRSVAAAAHQADCIRLAVLHADDPKRAAQLSAQAASMGREERGSLGMLLRLQAVRKKREANETERESAALTEQSLLGLMTEGLERIPPPPAPPPAATAPGKRPMAPPPRDYEEWSDEEKHVDLIRWQADRYAIQHTLRVQLIRKLGGLPPDCDFEPPPPEVLEYLIHADSENMRWADSYEPWKPKQPK
jgi:hypothetical protein